MTEPIGFCPECGAKRGEGEDFCGECGTKLEEAATPETVTSSSRVAPQAPPQVPPQAPSATESGFYMPYPAKPFYFLFLLFLLFLSVLLGGFIPIAVLTLFALYSILVFILASINRNSDMMKKTLYGGLATFMAIFVIIVFFVLPYWTVARPNSHFVECQSNLKNISTALEMFYTDNQGRYPAALSCLIPKYLNTIPRCASAGRDTYSAGYVVGRNRNVFTVYCSGSNHKDKCLQNNFPQYDSIDGLHDGTDDRRK